MFAGMFALGDKVSFLNEPGGGIIKEILSADEFLVETEDGFDQVCLRKDLVPKSNSQDYTVSTSAVNEKVQADLSDQQKRILNKQTRHTEFMSKGEQTWEIDLHIEEILDDHRHMNNSEIIQVQLSRFKSFLHQAQNKHIGRLIIIHGRGEGVLKNEIQLILNRHPSIEYHDASYREYGYGATEVRIHY